MLFNFILWVAIAIFSIVPLQALQAAEVEQKNLAEQQEISPERQAELNQELAQFIGRFQRGQSLQPAVNLVKQGADINISSLAGSKTLLNAAITNGDKRLVGEFIDQGARNPRDEDTPLIVAIKQNKPAIVEMFLARGASVDANFSEFSPLTLAASISGNWTTPYPNPKIVKLLLNHGANPLWQDGLGKTALMIVKEKAQSWSLPYDPESEFYLHVIYPLKARLAFRSIIRTLEKAELDWKKGKLKSMQAPSQILKTHFTEEDALAQKAGQVEPLGRIIE